VDPLLTCLHTPEHPGFELLFGLEPVVQVTAWLFATFEIDFVCATSDLLVRRRVPFRNPSCVSLGCFGLYISVSLLFR